MGLPIFSDLTTNSSCKFLEVSCKNDSYILDHNIDDKILMPAVSYLFSVWEGYSKMINKNMFDLNIKFSVQLKSNKYIIN